MEVFILMLLSIWGSLRVQASITSHEYFGLSILRHLKDPAVVVFQPHYIVFAKV
jgi:hypothetical protein